MVRRVAGVFIRAPCTVHCLKQRGASLRRDVLHVGVSAVGGDGVGALAVGVRRGVAARRDMLAFVTVGKLLGGRAEVDVAVGVRVVRRRRVRRRLRVRRLRVGRRLGVGRRLRVRWRRLLRRWWLPPVPLADPQKVSLEAAAMARRGWLVECKGPRVDGWGRRSAHVPSAARRGPRRGRAAHRRSRGQSGGGQSGGRWHTPAGGGWRVEPCGCAVQCLGGRARAGGVVGRRGRRERCDVCCRCRHRCRWCCC